MNLGNYIWGLFAATLLFAPLSTSADITDDFDGTSLDSSIWTAAATGDGTYSVAGSAVTLVNPTAGGSQRSMIISKDNDVQPFSHVLEITVSGLTIGGTSSGSSYNTFNVSIGDDTSGDGGGDDSNYVPNYMEACLGFQFETRSSDGTIRLVVFDKDPYAGAAYTLSAIPTDFTIVIDGTDASDKTWTIEMTGATYAGENTISRSFVNFGIEDLTYGESYLAMGVFNRGTCDTGSTADIDSVSVTGTSPITPPPVIEPAVYPPAPVLNANPISPEYIVSANDYTQIIYIDPTAPSGGNGSLAAPFTSWDNVSFSDNTAYLQKCGTTNYITAQVRPDGYGVLLGAYSDGSSTNRPVIYAVGDLGHIVDFCASDCTIRDLEITGTNGMTCIRFASWAGALHGGTIYNCYLHGASRSQTIQFGVRFMGQDNITYYSSHNRVLNTFIDWIGEDGIYINNSEYATVGYCNIIHVNQDWFISHDPGISGGDGIQFNGNINGYHVHHNFVDRSDTGNKFCIIPNAYQEVEVHGVVENNYLIAPQAAHAIYFHYSASNYYPVVRNNVMISNPEVQSIHGIYNIASHPSIHHNLFKGFQYGITTGSMDPAAEKIIDHNTFVDITDICIRNGNDTIILRNNLFDIPESTPVYENPSRPNLFTTNNFFVNASQAMGVNPATGSVVFLDPVNNLYLPMAQSDSIDQGMVLAEYTEDAHGNPYVGTPDPGYLEYGTYFAPLTVTASSSDQIDLEVAGSSFEHYIWLSTPDLNQPFQLLQATTNAHVEVSTVGQTNAFFQLMCQGGPSL